MPSSSRDENSGSASERGRVRFVSGRSRAQQAMTLAYPGLTQTQLPTASRRPLRPSALPAPRPRIAVGLSTCDSGGPCRANLWIGDPRDRLAHIVVHRHREGLVLLLDKGRDQILSLALMRHSPQRRRQVEPTGLKDWHHAPDAIGLRQPATQLDYLEPIIALPLSLANVFDVRLHPIFFIADPFRPPLSMQPEQLIAALRQVQPIAHRVE